MGTSRQVFDISTSAAKTDTGPPVFGQLMSARWEVTSSDTGADLAIFAQQRESDTGNGVPLVDDNDCLGADFFRQWRSATHTIAGVVDTGDDWLEPPVMAGDRLRVKVTPAGGTCAGRLYLWFKD